jgi:hypothetical protein
MTTGPDENDDNDPDGDPEMTQTAQQPDEPEGEDDASETGG